MRDVAKSANAGFAQVGVDFPPPIGGLLKRSFDIAGSVAGLILLSPLFLMVALLVKLSDNGPIFYGHKRIGRGGRIFSCLKFRTMVTDGERVLAAYLAANPEANAEWIATRKLKNDPRVTRVGQVLRKLSLDELPQILNILQGDMSLVGPRPVVRDELEIYGSAAVYYLKSRPGLTGLWQVSGRNDVSYDTRVAFDRHYVENWSMFQDIRIIFKTVPAVWMSRGSY
ncbi:sugar transferase [Mesorhizobium sp. M2D.F.Ca.ET.185.01.1.1]|uniref:sugar transferase n=2 Tax=Mesorhizobium TaxID=68287 RepID=UPI000FC9BE9B|nr:MULTISPECIES: sugar transferase [unclassified Mesorhizobium]TGP82310.1 sugar transferase [bacterium M00.F.Ca.ET.227.01.1.1]TGP91805.1 sugar transferase [bacterium M00.F.Ca.ET.221.01.1.1]TGP95408.1 sugar transferase [bacterium M00.F.Ca.ET.222.01.1.1]TGT71337.1 sugar transferase [bacterium M00.F.Ca.ET.159.01.1.1]TGT83514.1 sugar transferase [bacterium M00.F.Ca.ET.157.01.1.1]TGU03597.1 sugar transferase [bacterium M00.F.Ca.ET.163.01.1.1]TGU38663.1 sugar transferase [bacterium M00.F.Ca.ET.156